MYLYAETCALTSRERARLQTFSDDFHFIGGSESVRTQVGMATPVDGANIIVEAILNIFAGNEYPTEPARWDEDEIRQMIETGQQKRRKPEKVQPNLAKNKEMWHWKVRWLFLKNKLILQKGMIIFVLWH